MIIMLGKSICMVDWEKGPFGTAIEDRDSKGQSLTVFIVTWKIMNIIIY